MIKMSFSNLPASDAYSAEFWLDTKEDVNFLLGVLAFLENLECEIHFGKEIHFVVHKMLSVEEVTTIIMSVENYYPDKKMVDSIVNEEQFIQDMFEHSLKDDPF